MTRPDFLKDNFTIGIIAPSFGVDRNTEYYTRHIKAIQAFEKLGINVKLCPSIYNLHKAQSNTPKLRAKELMDFYLDEKIDVLWSVAGGEIMCEILPFIDFEKLRQAKAKWFIGFSDNTNFSYPLASVCDVASIYGMCSQDFNSEQPQEASYDIINLLMGKKRVFKQYLDDKTLSLSGHNEKVSGYMIGGCADIIQILLGTKFDQTLNYIQNKKEVILFLEACDLHMLALKRFFWQIKQLGYLDNIKALIFGKMRLFEAVFDVNLKEVLESLNLNIPVIYNVELGHSSPTMPFVSNVYTTVELKDGVFTLEYDF